MHQNAFGGGAPPGPPGDRGLQHSPRPLSWIGEGSGKGEEEGGEWEGIGRRIRKWQSMSEVR